MQLATSTSADVALYLRRSQTIVVPIGSTEQHGPIGLIGTDTLCAQTIATRLGERTGVLVAPPIALTVAQFNMGFPGTIAVRAATLLALLVDVLHALADQGFKRIYLLNGHGANIAVARAAFQDFYLERARIGGATPIPQCRLRSWWEYPQVDQLRRDWYGAHEGLHATPSEIAIAMAVEPEHGTRAREQGLSTASSAPTPLSPAFLRDHGGDNHLDAASHQRAFPDGRVGSHSLLATHEQGVALLAAAVDDAAADVAAFESEA